MTYCAVAIAVVTLQSFVAALADSTCSVTEHTCSHGISMLQTSDLKDRSSKYGAIEPCSSEGATVSAPYASNWLGWGRNLAEGDYWNLQNLDGESLFNRGMPDNCFEEAHCSDSHNFKTHSFASVASWSSFYSSTFGVGLSAGYQGITASIDASLGSTARSSGRESNSLVYAVKAHQRKCYRLIRDDMCAYNKAYLQPALLDRLNSTSLPAGAPYSEETMQAWQAGFITRFGTHIALESAHGALVHAIESSKSRSESASATQESGLCLKFGWIGVASAGLEFCANRSTSDETSEATDESEATCSAIGGDPLLQNQICRKDVTTETIDTWLAGGDLQAGSSAFRYSFMPISDFLTNVDFDQFYNAAQTLEKAVEYSNCRTNGNPPVQEWRHGKCECVRACANGGVLEPSSCTCKCRGNLKHGWKGANCQETYGSCQAGAGTGNPGAAARCPVANTCASWYRSHVCKPTDVCCATNSGTTCCPFGNSCRCGASSCSCVAPR